MKENQLCSHRRDSHKPVTHMCYHHFAFFHHGASLIVYVILSILVPSSLYISDCLCVIINFVRSSWRISACICVITTVRSFIMVYLWLSMWYYHVSFLNRSAHLVVFGLLQFFVPASQCTSCCQYVIKTSYSSIDVHLYVLLSNQSIQFVVYVL